MEADMSIKNVKKSLNEITKSLSASQESREFLIRNSRQVIITCSHAIIAVHKGDLEAAKKKAYEAKKLLSRLKKKAVGDLNRYLITPEQELVEAFSLIAIYEKKDIPSVKMIGVSNESYILGLLDCIGELKRLIYDKIRVGDSKDASRVFDIMQNLYKYLYPFAAYDKIVKEARRKLDVNRILVEDARSALTEEIRRSDLINAIKKSKK